MQDHKWSILKEFQQWLGGADNVEAYAVRCPDRSVSVAVIQSRFEFLQADRLLLFEALHSEERDRLIQTFENAERHRFGRK